MTQDKSVDDINKIEKKVRKYTKKVNLPKELEEKKVRKYTKKVDLPKEPVIDVIKNPCNECNTPNAKIMNAFGIRLCDICRKLDKYTLICKSTAKKSYFINDEDIEDLEAYAVKNPHYKSAADMILLKEADVRTICCEKYGITPDGIEDKLKELELLKADKKHKIANTKTIKKNTRKEQLVDALNEYKLKLRADSKLCTGYIDGTIKDYSIPQIVNRMCQMKYLYDYCDMDEAYEEAKESQREEINAGYFPDCSLFDQAEMIALHKKGGKYPAVYPWMKVN